MLNVGAVVVHYGSFDLLFRCLSALVPQVHRTVVVNHDSHPVPMNLKAGFGASVVWDEPCRNLGFARGVNRGFALLDNEFLLVANPDTTLGDGAVGALVAFLLRHPRMALAGPRLCNPNGTLQTSSYRLPTLVQLAGHLLGVAGRVPPAAKRALGRTKLADVFGQLDPHTVEREVEMVSGACFMLRRAALFDAGPLDPGFFLYYEEKDLCRRLWNAGWAVGFTPTATAGHVIGGSAPSRTARAHRHRAISALRYFQRHGNAFQRSGVRALLCGYSLVSMPGAHRAEHMAVLKACLSPRLACGSC
ncbi:glycosyltransferase family 2 protein [Candidatus Fermentibacteria bacterium]|nr:glycosyltransferase family 2 protein [Candidatus Fermentibacteria bacterium]